MVSTHHLRHLSAIAQHGHVGRAAAALGISQPALSRSMFALEKQLGARLLDRGSGGVKPTAYGQLVLARARVVLAELSMLDRELGEMKGLARGGLSITMAPYPSALSGQSALARFLAAHPAIHCRVRTGGPRQVADDVLAGISDLGIGEVTEAELGGELESEPLVTRPVSLFCRPGHPVLARRRATIADVAAYPWACSRMPGRVRAMLPATPIRGGRWDDATGEFVPAIESDLVGNFALLARETNVLLVGTLTMLEHELVSKHLCVVPFSESWARLNYGFIRRRNRQPPPAVRAFADMVRETEMALERREHALRAEYLPVLTGRPGREPDGPRPATITRTAGRRPRGG